MFNNKFNDSYTESMKHGEPLKKAIIATVEGEGEEESQNWIWFLLALALLPQFSFSFWGIEMTRKKFLRWNFPHNDKKGKNMFPQCNKACLAPRLSPSRIWH